MRAATSAAAPAMKPSTTTGTRAAAAPRTTPASPAISKPPSLASTSRASPASGRLIASPRRITSTLRRNVVVVDAGAAAGDLLGRRAREHRRERAGRGRVADAHVADADQADAVARERVGQLRARRQRRQRLRARHRGPAREVRGSGADAPRADLRRGRRRMRDAHVDDDDARARLPREHVDGGAAAREVQQHLPGHFLRVGADALRRRRRGRRPSRRSPSQDGVWARRRRESPASWQTRSSSRPRLRRGLVLSSSIRCADAAAALSVATMRAASAAMSTSVTALALALPYHDRAARLRTCAAWARSRTGCRSDRRPPGSRRCRRPKGPGSGSRTR